MANWISELNDGEQQSFDDMNAKGLTGKAPKKEPGLFDGIGTAVPRGVAAGAIKVYDTAKKPFERVADHVQYAIEDVQNGGLDGGLDVREPSFTDVHEAKNKDRRDALVSQIEDLQDAPNSGTAANITFGISDFAIRALGGGVVAGPLGAAAVTGGSEMNYSREDLISKGVDEDTATKVAALDGTVAAVSTALPISYGFKGTGGLLKDGLLSVLSASGLSQGGQFVSGQILEANDYEKQAKKYEVNKETVTTDILLNTFFFGAARGASAFLDNSKVTPEQKQAALVLNELEFDDAAAPVKPANAVQANNHLKNMDSATGDIRAGRPVRVQHAVEGEEKRKSVNYESMALPANAKSIARKAQQEGVDPAVALTISHIETSGSFSHTAKKSYLIGSRLIPSS